jgi:hypothetical protein
MANSCSSRPSRDSTPTDARDDRGTEGDNRSRKSKVTHTLGYRTLARDEKTARDADEAEEMRQLNMSFSHARNRTKS